MISIEGQFELETRPSEEGVVFQGNLYRNVETTLTLTNKSEARMAWKVKCTNNDMFKIRPPYGELEHGKVVDVKLTYQPIGATLPNNKQHHFTVSHIPQPEGAMVADNWAMHVGPAQGVARIQAVFQHDGTQSTASGGSG